MARQARSGSNSGYYHIIVRGIGKQLLFEERKDYTHFLSSLERFSREAGVTLCAYCLMENHVHLLLRDAENSISLMMKKLGVSYSYYFNKKYDRAGHLFQDRYLSESVEDDAYLLTVFRYILRNPQKAGICRAEDYEWSSYRDYAKPGALVDTSVLESLIGGWEEYTAFIHGEDDAECMEFQPAARDDAWAERVIRRELHVDSGTALQKMPRAERNAAIQKLKNARMTAQQIERLTGISRGVIQKVQKA